LPSPDKFGPLQRRAGIALCRKHDRERAVVREFDFALRQITSGAGKKNGKQIFLKPRQYGLRFGIAKTHIEFDEFWPFGDSWHNLF
jgi:hypothetical protein